MGSLTVGVVTIPFSVEGARVEKAREGLRKLADTCDSVIVIDNNRLRTVAGNLPLREAFGVANETVGGFIKSISDAMASPGHMNMDFADLKTIMGDGGVCAIGFGEGYGDNMVEDAIDKAITTQLLDIADISKAQGALIHIEGGEDMTLDNLNRAGELVLDKVSPDARVIWGAKINVDLKEKIRATVVLAGVESPFLEKAKPPAEPEPSTKKAVVRKTSQKGKKKLTVSSS
jgi:cell division protein FtsZ